MSFIKDILKGVMIGIANAVPGVSGGTMMVSMGIYDKIIYAITHLFSEFKKSVKLLLPYLIGMVLGIVGLAFVIKFLFANFEFQTKLAFVGLIVGGLPLLFGKIKGKKKGLPHIVVFLLFFAAIIAMQVFGGEGKAVELVVSPGCLIMLFIIGVIASATMVIPGVSGSMMLMILGYYSPIMGLVTELVKALAKRDTAALMHNCILIMPFGVGVVLGIFGVAKLIEFLMKKYEVLTYSAILGLVVSSPVVIMLGTSLGSLNVVSVLTGVVALIVGTGIAYKLSD